MESPWRCIAIAVPEAQEQGLPNCGMKTITSAPLRCKSVLWLHVPQPTPETVPTPGPDVFPTQPPPGGPEPSPPEIIEPLLPGEHSPVGEPGSPVPMRIQ